MSLDHEAIYKSHPTVNSIDDGEGCKDKDGNTVTIDQSLVDAARTTLDEEATAVAYKFVREPLYPALGDFADAMYWNSKGDSSKLTAYYAACEKVKTDNPKPS